MDLACTCDGPRVYLAGDPGVSRLHAERPLRQRDTRSLARAALAASPLPAPSRWMSRCVLTSAGVSLGVPGTMINYIRTDEQTWSKHCPETAFTRQPRTGITPGQDGCAARDLNPEPAD
jgi:hypothetical protein